MNILHSANDHELVALAQLTQGANASILSLLERLLEDTHRALVVAGDTVHIHRLQGRAEVLSSLLEAAVEAPQVLERSRSVPRG